MIDTEAPTILIVEDEVLVRMLAVDALVERGLPLVEAGTATEALEVLATRPNIRLMIVDISMPGDIDGLALARKVADRHPGLPILITSGRHEPQGVELPPNTRFLPKPFSDVGLNWAVDEALGSHCS